MTAGIASNPPQPYIGISSYKKKCVDGHNLTYLILRPSSHEAIQKADCDVAIKRTLTSA